MIRLKQKQANAKLKASELSRLTLAYKAAVERSKQDQKSIPQILVEGDIALRKAQQLRSPMAKTTDKATLGDNQKTLKQAQKIADEKAALLVATRRDLYASFDKATSLQKQIKTVSAQKEAAERGAKLEAIAIENIKQASETRVASSPEAANSKAAATHNKAKHSGHSNRIAGNGRNAKHL